MCSRGSHVLWAGDLVVLGGGQTSRLHNLACRMLRIGCGRGGRGGGGMCEWKLVCQTSSGLEILQCLGVGRPAACIISHVACCALVGEGGRGDV